MFTITSTNELPDLPRKLNKREASITPKIIKWFKENYPESVALEIKITKTNSIPRSALLPHQQKALIAVQTAQGLTHKLSDIGHIRQPFDAFIMKNTRSFVIACLPKHKVALAILPQNWNGANRTAPCEFKIPL